MRQEYLMKKVCGALYVALMCYSGGNTTKPDKRILINFNHEDTAFNLVGLNLCSMRIKREAGNGSQVTSIVRKY